MIAFFIALAHIICVIVWQGLLIFEFAPPLSSSQKAALVFTFLFSIVAFNANAFLLIIERSIIGGGEGRTGVVGTTYIILHTIFEALFILVVNWIMIGLVAGGAALGGTIAAVVAFSVLVFVLNIAICVLFLTGVGVAERKVVVVERKV